MGPTVETMHQYFGNSFQRHYLVVCIRPLRWGPPTCGNCILAHINVECDLRAKSKVWEELMETRAPPSFFPHEPVWCWAGNIKITVSVGPDLRLKTSKEEIRHFLHQLNILSGAVFHTVGCTAIDKMMEGGSHLFQLWAVKHVSFFCGSNTVLFKWREVPDPKCPCCKQPGVRETALH